MSLDGNRTRNLPITRSTQSNSFFQSASNNVLDNQSSVSPLDNQSSVSPLGLSVSVYRQYRRDTRTLCSPHTQHILNYNQTATGRDYTLSEHLRHFNAWDFLFQLHCLPVMYAKWTVVFWECILFAHGPGVMTFIMFMNTGNDFHNSFDCFKWLVICTITPSSIIAYLA